MDIFDKVMGRYCFFRVAAVCPCCLRLLLCDVRTFEIFVVAFLDVGQITTIEIFVMVQVLRRHGDRPMCLYGSWARNLCIHDGDLSR